MKNFFLIFLIFLVLNAQEKENPFIVKELDSVKEQKDSNTYDFFDFSKDFVSFSHSKNDLSISGGKSYTIKGTIFNFNKSLFIDDKGYFIDLIGEFGQFKTDIFDSTADFNSIGIQGGKKFSQNFILSLRYFHANRKITIGDNDTQIKKQSKYKDISISFRDQIFQDFYFQTKLYHIFI